LFLWCNSIPTFIWICLYGLQKRKYRQIFFFIVTSQETFYYEPDYKLSCTDNIENKIKNQKTYKGATVIMTGCLNY